MRLNEKSIRGLESPAKGNRIFYDDEIGGLGLRVTAAGARAFVLSYRIDGRERRMTLGSWPQWSTTAARERAKELRRLIDQGKDPLAEKQARREAPTVEDIVGEYLDRHAAKKKTGHIDREYLVRDLLPVWGGLKAADLRRRDVLALVERKAQTTPIAANMLLTIIKGVFNWAVDHDYLEQSPANRIKPPTEKVPRDRWLSEQEIRTAWARLEKAAMAPDSRAALRLILITAQRPGEVLSAEWSEIDFETALWTIPAAKSKNRKQQSVPLSSLALEHLERLKRGRWVIPGWYRDGRAHLTVAALSNAVIVNREHFGIPHWTPHDLRRTAATQMAKAGVPRFTIERILNHADKTITATYERHSYDAEKRQALERWGNKLREIVTGKPATKVVSIS